MNDKIFFKIGDMIIFIFFVSIQCYFRDFGNERVRKEKEFFEDLFKVDFV